MTIPYTFANATTAIPLAELDSNFASPITLGNVAMTLSNTYTSIGNLTLTNVTISSTSTPITVPQGGTGLTSLTSYQIPYGNGTSALNTSSQFTYNGAQLQISQNVASGNAQNLILENSSTTGTVTSSLAFTSAGVAKASITSAVYGNGYMAFATNDGTEKMRIDASGNVGIGTASPATFGKFAVLSTGTPTTAYASILSGVATYNAGFESTLYLGSARTDILNNGSIAGYRIKTLSPDAGSAYLAFEAASSNPTSSSPPTTFTERMRIDSSGNLLVGTTNTSNSPPNGINAVAITGGTSLNVGHANGTPNGYSYMQYAYNGTTIGYISQNGTTAVLYNTTSDYRLKNDVIPLANGLSTIQALNPVSFTWVDGRKDDGFLAHELQAVIPNCVTGEKDAVNEDGTPKYQQMDNSGVIPFLVKAIQEQQAIIEQLKAKVGL